MSTQKICSIMSGLVWTFDVMCGRTVHAYVRSRTYNYRTVRDYSSHHWL